VQSTSLTSRTPGEDNVSPWLQQIAAMPCCSKSPNQPDRNKLPVTGATCSDLMVTNLLTACDSGTSLPLAINNR
jgi:hypothetical protein